LLFLKPTAAAEGVAIDQRHELCWDIFRVFRSRRGDNADRRILQPGCYGRMRAGAECIVHFEVLFFSGTSKEESMAWTTPVLLEICIGLQTTLVMPARYKVV
jgi:hypothetical protein